MYQTVASVPRPLACARPAHFGLASYAPEDGVATRQLELSSKEILKILNLLATFRSICASCAILLYFARRLLQRFVPYDAPDQHDEISEFALTSDDQSFEIPELRERKEYYWTYNNLISWRRRLDMEITTLRRAISLLQEARKGSSSIRLLHEL